MADIRINQLPTAASPVASLNVAVDGAATEKVTIQTLVDTGRPLASQAEAEAGTNPSKAMTPLTTAQAIAAQAASAAQGALANTALQPSDIGLTVASAADGELARAAFGPLFNIEDYGGSPGADIAAAIAAAAAAVPAPGGTIVFPRFGYELNSLVEIGGKSLRLMGPGSSATTIKMTSGTAGIVYEGTDSRHLFEVTDMAFGAFAASTGTAIEATWTTTNGNEAQFVGKNIQFHMEADNSYFQIGLRLNNCRNPKINQMQMAGAGPTTTSTMLEIDGVTTDASISDIMTAHVQIPVRIQGASEGIMISNSALINCDIGVKADFVTSKPYIALTAVNINARTRCVSAYNAKQIIAIGCNLYANTFTVDQPGWEGIYIDGEGGANGAQTSLILGCLFFGQGYTGSKKGLVVDTALYINSWKNIFYSQGTGIEWMAGSEECRSDDFFQFCTTEITDTGTNNIRTGVSAAAGRAFMIGGATSASLVLQDNGSTANAKAFRLQSDSDRLRIASLNDNYTNRQILAEFLPTLISLGGTAGGSESLRANVVASAVNRIDVFGSATGARPSVKAAGSDTNISLEIGGKNAGVVVINPLPPSYANDAAVATAGFPVGTVYHNTTVGALKVRMT